MGSVNQMIIRTYSELLTFNTFEERYKYLQLNGVVGNKTFGFGRYINQLLYQCGKWKETRNDIIIRDDGCDLGMEGYKIAGRIIVHHINEITVDDILLLRDCVFDHDNLISTSHSTHNAIHYGDESLLVQNPIIRSKHDTCPWRH